MARTRWLIAGVAVAVVGVAAAVVLTSRAPTPADAALSYLDALRSGRVEAVEATGIEVSVEARQAFAGASAFLDEPRVHEVTVADDHAVVRVSYTLGAEQFDAEIAFSKVDGRWVPVPDTTLGELRLSSTSGSFATVGEASLPVGTTLPLLPAEYQFAAAPAALLDGGATVRVRPGESVDVLLETTLTTGAADIARARLHDHLSECTEAAPTVPAGCGIRIPWAADLSTVSEIHYRMERAPTLALSETGFRADGGVLVATVSGTGHDGTAGSHTYRTQNWSLLGDISFTADDLELSVW